MAGVSTKTRPLHALLSRPLVAFTRDFEAGGDVPTLPLWAGFLRALGDGPMALNEMREATRLSKRAVVVLAKSCVPTGLAGFDGRTLRLTANGRRAREAGRRRAFETEASWPAGTRRAALEALVAQFELELPHYTIGYGAVDNSVGRGGQDWRPVPRAREADTVSGVTLPGLLAQALMNFALDYERHGAWSLAGASIIARITDGMPLPAQPRGAGIMGGGRSGFERHDIVRVDSDRRIRLTERGRFVQAKYRELPPRIEKEWAERYGRATAEVRRALEALDATLRARFDHLPDHPVISWAGGIAEASGSTT